MLCKKAKEGVEIRIIIDDVGSSISSKMKLKLRDCGVEMHSFMPVLFSKFTGQVNYRDHRKIIVIDGKIGYLGGVNVSDRYVNANNKRYWRDTHVRIIGEAVKQLQILFFTTWDFVVDDNIEISKEYFPEHNCEENIPLQIAASGPDTDWSNIMEAMSVSYTHLTLPTICSV